jgi:hypothetical protein
MDNITLDDIIGSFPTDNDEREKRLEGIEEMYRDQHNVLNYYHLINPFLYREELKPGVVIRYSSRIDRLSCASRIIQVFYSPNKVVSQLKLVAINKGNNSEIWEIYPELYYIFKYDPKVTKLRRAFYQAGLTTEELQDPENELRQSVMRNEARKKQTRKTKRVINNIVKNDGNKLNINTLIRADPSLAAKVFRSDQYRHDQNYDEEDEPDIPMQRPDIYRSDIHRSDIHRSDIHRSDVYRPDVYRPDVYRPDMHRPQMTSLLDDSDEESQKEYEEELGFIPDQTFFDQLDSKESKKPKKTVKVSTKSKSRSNSKGKKKKTNQNWEVNATPRRTETLMEALKKKKKNSKTGKVQLTDDLIDLM